LLLYENKYDEQDTQSTSYKIPFEKHVDRKKNILKYDKHITHSKITLSGSGYIHTIYTHKKIKT